MDTNPTPSASEPSLAGQPNNPSNTAPQFLNSPLLTPVAVLLAGVFIGGAILWNGANPAPSAGVAGAGAAGGGAAAVNIKDVNIEGRPYIGDAGASVTVAYWTDYQCPFCKKFEEQALPKIVQEYVNTGKVKIVFFNFPLTQIHPNAMAAAEAVEAAGIQGKYLEMHHLLFTKQDEWSNASGGDMQKALDKYAASLGLDIAKFDKDMKSEVVATMINADLAQGQKFGVNGTPGFIIGKQLIAGAYPFEAFKEAIDPLLK